MNGEHGAAMVAAAQAGDQRAQDELVAQYLPLVYNIVGRALDGHSDVDDVVQETMLHMIDGLGGLRDPASFRSWLVAIAMNQVRRHWQTRRAAPIGGGLQDALDIADPGADFVDLTIVRLGLSGQRREVADATRWLDSDDRGLLSLWWLEAAGELTRAEVADALELSQQHAAVRIQRMKAQLETARVVVRALSAIPRCAALESMTAEWDELPSALWRKRIARHARGCAACSGHWSGLVPAEGLLVGLALVPLTAGLVAYGAMGAQGAVAAARGAVAHLGSTSDAGAGHAAHAGHAGHAGDMAQAATRIGHGHGRDGDAPRGRHRLRSRPRVAGAAAGVAAVTAVTAILYAAMGSPGDDGERVNTASATGTRPAVTVTQPTTPQPSTTSPTPPAEPSRTPTARPTRTAAPKPTPRITRAAPAPGKADLFVQRVMDLLNSERAKQGCPALHGDDKLQAAAQRHSADMAARHFFDHTNPDGAGPGDRITAAGYHWSAYAENIAYGQSDPDTVMDTWMHSPGHRANILNCELKEVGVGVQFGQGGPWWTQDFGTES